MTLITDTEQLVNFLIQLGISIEESEGLEAMYKNVRDAGVEWLVEKRAKFSGDEYFDQLEKNAVYLWESALVCNFSSAIFLHTGEPVIAPDSIPAYLQLQRQLGHQYAIAQLHYLRGSCTGCEIHDRHDTWANYRNMRATPDRSKYVDVLEYACIQNQGYFMVSQYFLSTLLGNHQFGGAAKGLPAQTVQQSVDQRVQAQASTWGGQVEYSLKAQISRDANGQFQLTPLSHTPDWQDIWGERFNEIAQSMQLPQLLIPLKTRRSPASRSTPDLSKSVETSPAKKWWEVWK